MCISPVSLKDDKYNRKVARYVPCGKCHECLRIRMDEWTWRMWIEAKHSDSCHFITLTYANEEDMEMVDSDTGELYERVLIYSDLKKFLQRLQKRQAYYNSKLKDEDTLKGLKRVYKPIRYFACGEYGSKTGRPHFHAIIYNCSPKILDEICQIQETTEDGTVLQSISPKSIWPHGYASISQYNVRRLAYTVKYVMKSTDEKFYAHLPKNFHPKAVMSKNPVIGAAFLKEKKYYQDNNKQEVLHPNGKKFPMPRYFRDRWFTRIEQMKYGLEKQLKMLERQKKIYAKYEYKNQNIEKIKYDQINEQIKRVKKQLQKEKL